jgi:hypothetical protein
VNNQEILDNAPEVKNNAGAMLYYSPVSEQYYEEHDGYWYEVDDYTMTKIIAPTAFVRSLSDIKRIAELEQVNDTLHKLMVSGESRGVVKATEEFKEQIVELEEIVKAVAHIGIDFGYGVYEIETKHIESARQYFSAKGGAE